MIELEKSGLKLYLNKNDSLISLTAPLQYDGYGRKCIKHMIGLLRDEHSLNLEEEFYDVYRGIRLPDDQAILESKKYRYDITVVMDGTVNGECKKTSGHYHGYNPQRTNTYAEVYEVIKGTALYVLQRADNFEDSPENIKIDDLILTVVREGQTILIPPNYGHCSINIGDGPLVFSNLAYVPCPVTYDSVRYYHGMSYYVLKENGQIRVVPNPHYVDAPKPKYAIVKENQKLGVQFGHPVYQAYKEHPDAFNFLGNPDPYVHEIMNMLDIKDTLKEVL